MGLPAEDGWTSVLKPVVLTLCTPKNCTLRTADTSELYKQKMKAAPLLTNANLRKAVEMLKDCTKGQMLESLKYVFFILSHQPLKHS